MTPADTIRRALSRLPEPDLDALACVGVLEAAALAPTRTRRNDAIRRLYESFYRGTSVDAAVTKMIEDANRHRGVYLRSTPPTDHKAALFREVLLLSDNNQFPSRNTIKAAL